MDALELLKPRSDRQGLRAKVLHTRIARSARSPRSAPWLRTSTLVLLLFLVFAWIPEGTHSAPQSQRAGIRHGSAEYRAWAIRKVFPKGYKAAAVRVARCESGHSINPRARNGQFRGAFQMGSAERRTYGHGRGIWRQARAALRYFNQTGRDWSPWSCAWAA